MQFKMLFTVATLSLIMVLSAAKPGVNGQAKEELLAGSKSKNWKLTDIMVGGVGISGDECDSDDFTTFYRNNNVEENEGEVICKSDPPVKKGKWYFNNEKTMLNINYPEKPNSYTIKELTKTRLIIISKFNGGDIILTYSAL